MHGAARADARAFPTGKEPVINISATTHLTTAMVSPKLARAAADDGDGRTGAAALNDGDAAARAAARSVPATHAAPATGPGRAGSVDVRA